MNFSSIINLFENVKNIVQIAVYYNKITHHFLKKDAEARM